MTNPVTKSRKNQMKNTIVKELEKNFRMADLIKKRLPELMGVTVLGAIIDIESVQYRVVEVLGAKSDYAWCVEASVEESEFPALVKDGERHLVYLPNLVTYQQILDNPLDYFEKIAVLAHDKDVDEDLREDFKNIENLVTMLKD